MAEELEPVSQETQDINRTEKRIKDLSSKVEMTAQERDEAREAAEKALALAQANEKERDFYKDFSNMTGKYQGAADHQDQILEKVKLGYTVEDATVAVLNAEGKLSPIAQSAPQMSAAGGSSATVLPANDRSAGDMTQAERRAELLKANDSGELAALIKNWGR